MLKLDDRLRVAMGADMGVQLTPKDVATVAAWLVVLRKIAKGSYGGSAAQAARGVLGELA